MVAVTIAGTGLAPGDTCSTSAQGRQLPADCQSAAAARALTTDAKSDIWCGRDGPLAEVASPLCIALPFGRLAPPCNLSGFNQRSSRRNVMACCAQPALARKMMKWGLLPHWAKDEKIAYNTFNARSEEFTGKPAFRDAWKRGQRCLVITNGFYEWQNATPSGR
jgi:SOS response associated peptidase (SRAP)